ncbi:uncharacterized protein V1516DRAFT_670527 [Lipomyces oligophaga]|uniref:uncharacterized protein n=1 Tax=Lipomyces oligophaga TaxID=45792 RepID=UPI0034CFE553
MHLKAHCIVHNDSQSNELDVSELKKVPAASDNISTADTSKDYYTDSSISATSVSSSFQSMESPGILRGRSVQPQPLSSSSGSPRKTKPRISFFPPHSEVVRARIPTPLNKGRQVQADDFRAGQAIRRPKETTTSVEENGREFQPIPKIPKTAFRRRFFRKQTSGQPLPSQLPSLTFSSSSLHLPNTIRRRLLINRSTSSVESRAVESDYSNVSDKLRFGTTNNLNPENPGPAAASATDLTNTITRSKITGKSKFKSASKQFRIQPPTSICIFSTDCDSAPEISSARDLDSSTDQFDTDEAIERLAKFMQNSIAELNAKEAAASQTNNGSPDCPGTRGSKGRTSRKSSQAEQEAIPGVSLWRRLSKPNSGAQVGPLPSASKQSQYEVNVPTRALSCLKNAPGQEPTGDYVTIPDARRVGRIDSPEASKPCQKRQPGRFLGIFSSLSRRRSSTMVQSASDPNRHHYSLDRFVSRMRHYRQTILTRVTRHTETQNLLNLQRPNTRQSSVTSNSVHLLEKKLKDNGSDKGNSSRQVHQPLVIDTTRLSSVELELLSSGTQTTFAPSPLRPDSLPKAVQTPKSSQSGPTKVKETFSPATSS